MRSFILVLIVFFIISKANAKQSHRRLTDFYVVPSVGEPWPKPQSIQTTTQQFAVHPDAFHFMVNSTSQTCDILTSALDRYFRVIFYPQSYLKYIIHPEAVSHDIKPTVEKSLGDLCDMPMLKRLDIYIQQPCDQYPSLESDESCKVDFNSISKLFRSFFSRYTYYQC